MRLWAVGCGLWVEFQESGFRRNDEEKVQAFSPMKVPAGFILLIKRRPHLLRRLRIADEIRRHGCARERAASPRS
jgi:hypothetical protein